MTMTGGYPAEADIDVFLTARGIDVEGMRGNCNFTQEFKQLIYRLLNDCDWAAGLAVYCPTSTTFNVRGGQYLYAGTVKTFTPGAAIDPTDNDTTYIWLTPTNTIGSGVDGSGWPGTAHIKLAEIDVDGDGVITAIRDMRGQTFMRYIAP